MIALSIQRMLKHSEKVLDISTATVTFNACSVGQKKNYMHKNKERKILLGILFAAAARL